MCAHVSVCRNNSGGGYAFLNTDVLISNTIFDNNVNNRSYNMADNIELTSDKIGFSGGLSMNFIGDSSRSVTVKNCMFVNNSASLNLLKNNNTQQVPSLYIPSGDGGAISIILDASENQKLLFEDVEIIGNVAFDGGGGMFIAMYNGSYENEISVQDSVFSSNHCGRGEGTGGAISMITFEDSNDNILIVNNTTFVRNSAVVGGGACSLEIQVSTHILIMNGLHGLVE